MLYTYRVCILLYVNHSSIKYYWYRTNIFGILLYLRYYHWSVTKGILHVAIKTIHTKFLNHSLGNKNLRIKLRTRNSRAVTIKYSLPFFRPWLAMLLPQMGGGQGTRRLWRSACFSWTAVSRIKWLWNFCNGLITEEHLWGKILSFAYSVIFATSIT